jgi:hypothetical protein
MSNDITAKKISDAIYRIKMKLAAAYVSPSQRIPSGKSTGLRTAVCVLALAGTIWLNNSANAQKSVPPTVLGTIQEDKGTMVDEKEQRAVLFWEKIKRFIIAADAATDLNQIPKIAEREFSTTFQESDRRTSSYTMSRSYSAIVDRPAKARVGVDLILNEFDPRASRATVAIGLREDSNQFCVTLKNIVPDLLKLGATPGDIDRAFHATRGMDAPLDGVEVYIQGARYTGSVGIHIDTKCLTDVQLFLR